jgi:hypothetical protein
VFSYHSCKNRSCCKCHTDDTQRWLEAHKLEMLPCHYFHIAVTVPEELRRVLRTNQQDGYALPGGRGRLDAHSLSKTHSSLASPYVRHPVSYRPSCGRRSLHV